MPQSARFPNNKPPLLFLPILCSLLLGLNSLSYGETWTLKNSGVTDLLHDITFTDPNNGWAVGRSGVIIHTTDGGESWTPQVSNVSVPLHSVDFVDSLNGWAVGLVVNNEGTILHTTDGGVNWVWQGNGQRTAMYDIEFLDLQNGIAVGGQALIMRTTDEGETWTTLNEEPNILFWDIEIIDESTWYIAGQHNINPGRPPVMYHTTDAGQTWSVLAEDGDWGLQSVSFIDPLSGWAVGWFGEILHTTDGGQTWTPQESGRTDEILFEVVFQDENVGWTVGGERGCQLWNCDSLHGAPNVVLLTTDGGDTWDLRPPLTDQLYVKIYFFSPDIAWIVGDGGTILKTTDATSVIPDPPNQTILLEPVDSAIVAQDSVTFLWQSGSGVDTYWLEYDTSSAFLSLVVDSTLTDTSHTVDGLQDNTEYWWRARGRNPFGWGPFSEMRQFIVSIPAATPDSVILLEPADGASDIPTAVDFLWMQIEADSSDSLIYYFQLATDTLFASLVFQDSSLLDTTVHRDSLSEESAYFWRVRAANVSGTGPWSNTWSFTTATAPPAAPDSVVLLQPADGVINQLTPLTLVWKSVGESQALRAQGGVSQVRETARPRTATRMVVDGPERPEPKETPLELFGIDSICYHLQLSTDAAFSTILIEDSTLIDTTYQLDSLDFGETYHWRVRALGAGIPGPWSEGHLFLTPDISSIPCQTVRRLQGRCRPNGTIVVVVALASFNYTGNNVVIALDGVQYMGTMASNRRAQISVPGFAAGPHTVELVNPGCLAPVTITCGALANQVDGNDEGESLEWGDDEEDLLESDLPATTELLGSYPNPFNSVATIAFQLAEQTRVDLRIYDILGREIEIVVNEELPAGRYAKTWTATAHASGLYFYRFTVGNSVLTGKLLQVK